MRAFSQLIMNNKNTCLTNLRIGLRLLSLIIMVASHYSVMAYEIDPNASIADSPTSILGINHIALSVKDLDSILEFCQSASDFKLIRRETVRNSSAADKLFGHESIAYEVAVLEAPNMLFELTAFSHTGTSRLVRCQCRVRG